MNTLCSQRSFNERVSLTHTSDTWKNILEAISHSTQSIYIGAFLWREDDLGNEVAEALLKAANKGVIVTIEKDTGGLYHEWAEYPHQSFFHIQGNIQTYLYTLFQRPKFIRQNKDNSLRKALIEHENTIFVSNNKEYIDHSKILIIDDMVVLGSMNIGDEYKDDWFDIMLHISCGNISNRINNVLQQSLRVPYVFGDTSFKFFRDIPSKDQIAKVPYFMQESLDMISQADKKICILGGYVSNLNIAEAIKKAMGEKQNLEVQIIIPAQPNIQKTNMQRFLKYLEGQIPGNVEYVFSKKMIHAKALRVDDNLLMGSSNFDNISGVITAETGVKIYENSSIMSTFEKLVQNIKDDSGDQASLSALFEERKLKNLIESYLQRLILSKITFYSS